MAFEEMTLATKQQITLVLVEYLKRSHEVDDSGSTFSPWLLFSVCATSLFAFFLNQHSIWVYPTLPPLPFSGLPCRSDTKSASSWLWVSFGRYSIYVTLQDLQLLNHEFSKVRSSKHSKAFTSRNNV